MYLKWNEYHKTNVYPWTITFYIKHKLTFSSAIDEKNANKCTQDKHHDQWKDPNPFRVVWSSLLICMMSSTVQRVFSYQFEHIPCKD